ncbi:MAG: FkbM family methyltransferase [Phycisphaerales bacterium]|nr:FkbM family methyltransferase [Phycisphaerales bacterium]
MLLNTLKYIYQHPLNADRPWAGLWKFFWWQIRNSIKPQHIIHDFTEHSKLHLWRGLRGATGNLYCGLMEYQEMSFVLHFLRSTDTFFDIGANVGVYTILASAEVGAQTISVEPIPATFDILRKNILLNKIEHKVRALQIGIGSVLTHLNFTTSLDTENHIALAHEHKSIEVEVKTIDEIAKQMPCLIKIDVEGFETEVLLGATHTLANPVLKAIIIELNGSGKKYGYQDQWIHEQLLTLGFKPYSYDPILRNVKELPHFGKHNTLYIRDKEYVLNRVAQARKIKIGNKEI